MWSFNDFVKYFSFIVLGPSVGLIKGLVGLVKVCQVSWITWALGVNRITQYGRQGKAGLVRSLRFNWISQV